MWVSPRAARSPVCRLVSFPGAGRGGPAAASPQQPPLRPQQPPPSPGGIPHLCPLLGRGLRVPAKVPQARGLWESRCSPPAGSDTGYSGGLRGPRHATRCSRRGLLAPGRSSTVGATAHLLVGCSPRLPATEVCGAGAGGHGVQRLDSQHSPRARRQPCAVLQAPEPSGHAATCCPRMAQRARGTGTFAPRSGGTSPGPPHAPNA